MPMSFMQGSSATEQQSQSTDRFFITLMNAIFPSKNFTTLEAASAMASQNRSCSACLFQASMLLSLTPPEWIRALPAREAQPMDSCLREPPKPPWGCPLKWARTSMES